MLSGSRTQGLVVDCNWGYYDSFPDVSLHFYKFDILETLIQRDNTDNGIEWLDLD